jgi:hypothetical protein
MSKVKKYQNPSGTLPDPNKKPSYGQYQGMDINEDLIKGFGGFVDDFINTPGNISRSNRKALIDTVDKMGEGLRRGEVPEFDITGRKVIKPIGGVTGTDRAARKNILNNYSDDEIGNVAHGLLYKYLQKVQASPTVSNSGTDSSDNYWGLNGAQKAVARNLYNSDNLDNSFSKLSVDDRRKQIAKGLLPELEQASNTWNENNKFISDFGKGAHAKIKE